MRSYLVVPGDQEAKLHEAAEAGADALILDLEDSVAAGAKDAARATVAGFLADRCSCVGGPALFVRVNPLGSGLTDDDIDAVVPAHPAGIVVPKAENGAGVGLVDASITAAEIMAGVEDGRTAILAIAAETAASLFDMGSFRGASRRLSGLTWGAEDLASDVGAISNRDAAGQLTGLYLLARSLCLAAAAAAEVAAIDAVFPDYGDLDGLRADCEVAVRDGFTGKLAIHPDQVATINDVFTPSSESVEAARAVVAALGNGSGVASLDGRMIDRPHLRRAERILARAASAGIA